MKPISTVVFVSLLAFSQIAASSWFGHEDRGTLQETELKRWLLDHDVDPSKYTDRKQLEDVFRTNWDQKVIRPAAGSRDRACNILNDSRQWLFETWDDSQLKAFLVKHGIVTGPKSTRETLLNAAKDNYDSVAKRLGEASRYPGDWLYSQWSDSDLKAYLDKYGYKVPQPTTRDRLIAAVRRASCSVSDRYSEQMKSASATAGAATERMTEAALKKWSDADFKKFFEQHGISVPSDAKRAEYMELVKKYPNLFTENAKDMAKTASGSISSAYDAATSKKPQVAQATQSVMNTQEQLFDSAVQKWSDLRLKEYLSSRQVPVPATISREDLLNEVRKYRNKAASGYGPWIFDTWDKDSLKHYLTSVHKKASDNAEHTREELLRQAQSGYAKAMESSGSTYNDVKNYITVMGHKAIDTTLHSWSRDDLEDYLKSFGIKLKPDVSLEDVRTEAAKHARFFTYGTEAPGWTWGGVYQSLANIAHGAWNIAKRAAYMGRTEGETNSRGVRQRIDTQASRVADEL